MCRNPKLTKRPEGKGLEPQCPLTVSAQVKRAEIPSTTILLTLVLWPVLNRMHSSCTTSRGFGWRIHCGVEVTESSTNQQHTHSILYLSMLNHWTFCFWLLLGVIGCGCYLPVCADYMGNFVPIAGHEDTFRSVDDDYLHTWLRLLAKFSCLRHVRVLVAIKYWHA